MPVRSAPSRPSMPPVPADPSPSRDPGGAVDPVLVATLDSALDRVRELSMRLWEVRDRHRPGRGRRGRRCLDCGQTYPCATARAAEPALTRSA